MRSSRSGADPLDPSPAGFAHRGLHGTGIPENSLAAFRSAIATGAGIECDVRLSADDVPVIYHDADLRRLCGEPGRPEQLSAAALGAKRLAGTSEAIPRLADLLMIARGHVPLLIELKTDGNAARLADAVCRTLGPCSGVVGVMSFDPRVAAWLARHRPDVWRGLVIDKRGSGSRRVAGLWLARPQFVAVDKAVLDQGWVKRLGIPVYCWTIRNAAERAMALPLASSLIWEAEGVPHPA